MHSLLSRVGKESTFLDYGGLCAWECMRNMASDLQGPWVAIGDFYEMLSEDEKRGGAPINLAACMKFREVLEQCGLFDIQSFEPRFTWKGPQVGNYSRVSSGWTERCAMYIGK